MKLYLNFYLDARFTQKNYNHNFSSNHTANYNNGLDL